MNQAANRPATSRLHRDLLASLAGTVEQPRYDVSSVAPSVVHIGPGVFHRGHQAVYSDAVLGTGSPSGAICAVSLRSPQLRDFLAEQDHLYSLLQRDDTADVVRVIGSIRRSLVAPEDPLAVLRAMTDPRVTVVTMTVTEKGYCFLGSTGALDTERAEILHDIAHPAAPQSLLGFLVEALALRRASGVAPFTVASCDNLQSNGATTRRLAIELAAHRADGLDDWIAAHVSFPSSMVDRMVPATTEDVRSRVRELAGYDDPAAVVTEPFSQWVLEDAFPSGRPEWERAGVQLVGDVVPFEQAKLRILNGAHSAFAYYGLLCGYAEIADAARDSALRAVVTAMLREDVIPTLATPPGMDLAAYADEVLTRFTNRTLGYTTAKVAGDGSQKLPIRILATVRDRLRTGGDVDRLASVIAAYVACLFGPRAAELAVSDPALERLLGRRPMPMTDPLAAVELFLQQSDIVDDLAAVPTFTQSVQRFAVLLWRGDPRTVLNQ